MGTELAEISFWGAAAQGFNSMGSVFSFFAFARMCVRLRVGYTRHAGATATRLARCCSTVHSIQSGRRAARASSLDVVLEGGDQTVLVWVRVRVRVRDRVRDR